MKSTVVMTVLTASFGPVAKQTTEKEFVTVLGTRIAGFEKAKTITDCWTKKVVTVGVVVTVLILRKQAGQEKNIYQYNVICQPNVK